MRASRAMHGRVAAWLPPVAPNGQPYSPIRRLADLDEPPYDRHAAVCPFCGHGFAGVALPECDTGYRLAMGGYDCQGRRIEVRR